MECEICGAEAGVTRTFGGLALCNDCYVDSAPVCTRCGCEIPANEEVVVGALQDTRRYCRSCADANPGFTRSALTWTDLGAVDAVGVEIEGYPKSGEMGSDWAVRMRREHPTSMRYWQSVHDGSLNDDGIELTSCPVPVKKMKTFFSQLKWLSKEMKVDDTCGLHVHANMRQYITTRVDPFCDYAESVQKLVVGFRALESFFFATQPSSRRSGNFSRSIGGYVRGSPSAIAAMRPLDVVRGFYPEETPDCWDYMPAGKYHQSRYCWVNIHAIYLHGTVELRIHSGTTNMTKIRVWASIFAKLVRHIMESDLGYLASGFWGPKALNGILNAEELAYLDSRIRKFNRGCRMDLSADSGISPLEVGASPEAA